MKITEIINEDYEPEKGPVGNDLTPHAGMHPEHHAVHGRVDKMRDVGGYDRVYHMNRMMMAMAMADGKSKKAVDMPAESWIEKYNTGHPYTDEEHNMIHSAMNTIPTDHKVISNDRKSREPSGTNITSPVPARKKNKHGV
jgi:hypothetical protein